MTTRKKLIVSTLVLIILVLLDMKMPLMDDYEAAKKMKATKGA